MSRTIPFAFATFCLAVSYCDAATHRWISVTGDFASPGSWSTSKVPSQWTTADDVLFDGPSQKSVTSGLDQGSVTVRSISFTSNYGGAIGQFGTPLRIIARTVSHEGTGKLYFDAPSSTTLCTVIVDDPTNFRFSEPYIYLSGHYYQVVHLSGNIDLLPNGTAYRIIDSPRNQIFQHLNLLGVDALTPAEMFLAGYSSNDRRLTRANMVYQSGGYFYQNGLIEDGATVNTFGGAEFVYSPTETDIVTHPILNLMGWGEHDFSHLYHEIQVMTGFVGRDSGFTGSSAQTYPRDMGLMDLYFGETMTVHQGDTDADGVPDLLDACNTTPAGAVVGPSGTLAGDLNGDCKVDLLDAALMQNTFTGP